MAKKTLFGYIDWFITEMAARIGSPTPVFFRVWTALMGFIFVVCGAVVGAASQEGNTISPTLKTACIVIMGFSGGGVATARLPRKDPPPDDN